MSHTLFSTVNTKQAARAMWRGRRDRTHFGACRECDRRHQVGPVHNPPCAEQSYV